MATNTDRGVVKRTPEKYIRVITEAALKHGVPSNILSALLANESNFNPNAKSSAGALGIAQFMPGTAAGFGIDPLDPIQAIDAAALYLSQLYSNFGSWDLALAGYNAGGGNVKKYGGIPPFAETQNYVKKIMAEAGDNLKSDLAVSRELAQKYFPSATPTQARKPTGYKTLEDFGMPSQRKEELIPIVNAQTGEITGAEPREKKGTMQLLQEEFGRMNPFNKKPVDNTYRDVIDYLKGPNGPFAPVQAAETTLTPTPAARKPLSWNSGMSSDIRDRMKRISQSGELYKSKPADLYKSQTSFKGPSASIPQKSTPSPTRSATPSNSYRAPTPVPTPRAAAQVQRPQPKSFTPTPTQKAVQSAPKKSGGSKAVNILQNAIGTVKSWFKPSSW